MKMPRVSHIEAAAALLASAPTTLAAQDTQDGGTAGGAALWIFANFSYAAMRAQDNPTGWRIVAFIFGFPGTLLSLMVVDEGSERMYGFDLPRKNSRR